MAAHGTLRLSVKNKTKKPNNPVQQKRESAFCVGHKNNILGPVWDFLFTGKPDSSQMSESTHALVWDM